MAQPFSYGSGWVNPYGMSIGDTLAHANDARAHAAEVIGAANAHASEVTGQAYAGAANDIGHLAASTIQQETDPRAELERQQAQQFKNTQQFTGVVNNIIDNLMKTNPDGSKTVDRSKAQVAFAQANVPLPIQQATFKQLDDMDASVQKFQQIRVDHGADAAHSAIQMIDAGMDPQVAAATALSYARENSVATDSELAPMTHAIANVSDPKDIKGALAGVRALSEKYKDQGKPVVLAGAARPGASPASLVSPTTGATIATGAAAGPAPLTPEQVALDAATLGTPGETPTAAQSARAIGISHPPPVRSNSEQLLEAVKKGDTQAANTIIQSMRMEAEAKGDPAAIAAANRQAATIAAQIAQQGRTQTFTEQQAGRAELTNKIEQPYLDAREKADTLKNAVTLAQNGNKEAANVQGLLATLGLVTSEGVKRINTTELDQVAGAGSLFDKIKARAGAIVAGQPIPNDLQKDLIQLSSMLEQSARKKYEQGFNQVQQRYKLTDEVQLPPSGAPDKGTAGAVGGKPAVWDYRNNTWGWWAK